MAKAEFQSEYRGTKRTGLRAREGLGGSLGVKSSGLLGVHGWFDVLQGVAVVSSVPSKESVPLVFETCRSSSSESVEEE